MAGGFDIGALPNYVASALMVGLAVLLLVIDIKGRVNRAFAAFLLARGFGLSISTLSIGLANAGSAWATAASRAGLVLHLATVSALVFFIAVYPERRGVIARRPVAFWLFITTSLGLIAWFLADACAMSCADAAGLEHFGPLALLNLSMVMGLGAYSFATERARAPPGPRQSALALVAGAFAVNALYDAARALAALTTGLVRGSGAVTAGDVPDVFYWAWLSAPVIGAVPAVIAMVLIGRVYGLPILAFGAAAVASGVFVGVTAGAALGGVVLLIQGLWRLTIPLLVAYAILRYQVVDFDTTARRAVGTGVIVVLVLGTFALVSEVTAEFLNESAGLAVGGMAAALLFLVQGFVSKGAKRMADKLVPFDTPREVDESFCIAVEMALIDGRITRAEERHLAVLADRLGLDAARAFDLRGVVEDRLIKEGNPAAVQAA